jgi:hypothetical protein
MTLSRLMRRSRLGWKVAVRCGGDRNGDAVGERRDGEQIDWGRCQERNWLHAINFGDRGAALTGKGNRRELQSCV